MKKITMTAKPNQSIDKMERLFDECFAHYEEAGRRGSTGYHGSEFEKLAEQALQAKGIQTAYSKDANHVDLIIYVVGKDGKKHRLAIEVKTGSGIVYQQKAVLDDHISNYDESYVLPKANLIAYNADPKACKSEADVLKYTLILSRQQFVDFVIENSGARKQCFTTAFKLGVNSSSVRKTNKERKDSGEDTIYTDCITLQSTYNKNRVQAIKKNTKYMTLGEFLSQIGR